MDGDLGGTEGDDLPKFWEVVLLDARQGTN